MLKRRVLQVFSEIESAKSRSDLETIVKKEKAFRPTVVRPSLKPLETTPYSKSKLARKTAYEIKKSDQKIQQRSKSRQFVRMGSGWSMGEIKSAGLTKFKLKRKQIPIDRLRRSTYIYNINTLKELGIIFALDTVTKKRKTKFNNKNKH